MASQTTSREVVLRATDIDRSFLAGERSIEVLHRAKLELRRGERLCLMGASGAGKSTFLHILGMLDQPDHGSIEILGGADVWTLTARERARLRNQHIGFVFQFYHLLPELDALENVLLPGMIASSFGTFELNRRQARERSRELLVRCGLEERLRHRPGQLSGGERQRVAIARALFLDPEIVIADEPTGNLDTATGERVLELLFDQQRERGLALLLVTHDERLAALCNRTLHMLDGRILDGSAAEVVVERP